MAENAGGLTVEVSVVRERIAHCRRVGGERCMLPLEVWADAVAVAQACGAYRAARELGVSYDSLHRRLREQAAAARGDGEGGFVEWPAAALVAAPVASETVVEVAAGDGMRVTIRLGPGQPLDAAMTAAVTALRARQP